MRKLGVHARLALSIALITMATGVLLFFAVMISSKSTVTAIQIEALTENKSVIQETVTRPSVLQLGITDMALKDFEKSPITEQGFLVQRFLQNEIYQVTKVSNGVFRVKSFKGITWTWFRETGPKIFVGVFLLSIFAWFFTWSLGAISLMPIKSLRKTTEDILAGRFEVKVRYRAKDEIGMTFDALRRLCGELEKKDEALEKVTHLATVDAMTGLKNHRAFKEELNRQLASAQRHGQGLGLAILDVDHFKKFNDTYGHQQGDEVLRTVGKTMKEAVRESDFVARYGGEEFVAIFPQMEGPEGVGLAAEKIRKAIEETKVSYLGKKGQTLSVTASFGAVFIDGKQLARGKKLEYTLFVEGADQNLYKAKKDGRNRVVSGVWDISQAPLEEKESA